LEATETVAPAAADALYYTDVDGDGIIAPHDALLVINYLIHHPPAASPAVAAPGDATPQVQAFAVTDEAVGQLTNASGAPMATPAPASTQPASTTSPSASQSLPPDAVTAAFDPAGSEEDANSLDTLIG
jgi:hypothetical protein